MEILSFDGCAHRRPAIELVERLSRELGIAPELRLVNVPDAAAARRLRFLGSPTIRVGGIDVEPRSDERRDYALSCRLFRTEQGAAGLPEERWVQEALRRESGRHAEPEPERVAAALEAAATAPTRCGAERTRRLSVPERQLYRWILERFAAAEPPSAAAAADEAAGLGLDSAAALATLADEDLVHADDGSIEVAYPFSARPRGHRVLVDDHLTVEAMCAIDALGIAPMLGLPIEVTSHDPREPQHAVVLAGCSSRAGASFRGCYGVVDFFESADSVERYLHENAAVDGLPVSVPEASAAGRAIFGDVLRRP